MSGADERSLVLYVAAPTADTERTVAALETEGDTEVVIARSVDEGIEALSTLDVDCIVSEYRLPDGDGLSFLETVRAEYRSLPFVIYAADGSESIAAQAFRNGVTDYVQQGNADLSARVDTAIEATADHDRQTDEKYHLRQFKKAIFESSVLVMVYDTDDSLTEVNDAVEEICGYTPGELYEAEDVWKLLYPDDEYRDEITSAGAEALRTDEYLQGFETTVTTKSGVERTLSWYAQPLTDKQGQKTGTVTVGRDVTERRERKQELEALTTRFELALEETNTGLWERDLETDEIFWDDACRQLFGYEPSEFSGVYEEFTQRVHDDDLPAVEAAMERAIATDSLYQADFRIELPTGDQRWIQSRGIVEYDAAGRPDRMLGIKTDITDRKTAEQALEETKEYYQRIFEQSSDFVLVVDEEGTINDVTAGIERILGYETDKLIGTDSFTHLHPEDEDRMAGAMAEVLEDPEADIEIEYRSQASDGSYRWLEARGSNYLDDPLLDGLVANVRDISERKHREQKLEALTTRLELALEGTDTGVWEWDPSTDELVWDEACERLFGYEPGGFPGTYEEVAERLSAADLAAFEQAVGEAIEHDQQFQSDFSIELPDGEQRWIQSRGIVEYNDDGTVDHLLGIKTDITDRKTAEQAVEETKEYYRRIFEQSSDFVLLLDESGDVLDVTQGVTHVMGYDPEEMIGTTAFQYVHPDDREPAMGSFGSAIEDSEAEVNIECRIRTSDGRHRWVEARGNDYFDDPLLGGVMVNVRDVSERKERERKLAEKTSQLQQKNEQLERLAQVVSHDLQTPLSTAEKLTQLLRADLGETDAEIEQSLTDLEATHQRLREFADHLPRLARESTDIEGPTECGLRTVATAAWDVVDTGPLDLRIESDRTLSADPKRLQRVFENLFQNTVAHAVRAVDSPGHDTDDRTPSADHQERSTATTVSVGSFSEGFFVADDGPGIRPEQRDEIFEYGMGTTSGSGFGLAIVRTIVEAHGWEIAVTEGETQGARFDIYTDS